MRAGGRQLLWYAGVGALASCFAALASGQTAQVSGRVTDPTGAIVPQARVTVINPATGAIRRTESNDRGYYVVPLLPPGRYQVIVLKEGFRPLQRDHVLLEVDRRVAIDFILEVGVVSETVQVSVDTPVLDSVEGSIGQVIPNRTISEMPLNGRDYTQLALLSAGTVQPVGGRVGGFSVSGQKTTQNNYLLDGMDNNSVEIAGATRRAEMVKPSIDAIQEFKVQSSGYSAEFGRAMGGVVNVTTKSGTNQVHGTAFWFLRNEALDAKNYFDPADKPKPPFKRNQYGFSLGGPVIKNKTFFFGDYEGTRIRESRTATSTIPTAAARAGDFSGLSHPIRDPSTGEAFPGNVVPESRLDPLARTLAGLYPEPTGVSRSANFVYQSPDREDVEKFDVRVDHTASPRDTFFVRLSFHGRVFPAALALPPPAFGGGNDGTVTGWNTGLNWNHVFGPNWIASFRAVWNYARFTRSNPAVGGRDNWNARFGVPEVDQAQPGGFAEFQISGYRTLGLGGFNGVDRDSQNRQFAGDLTWTRSSHTVKLGASVIRSQNNIFNIRKEVGSFRFRGRFSGDAMADFLLGATDSFNWSNRLRTNLRGWLAGAYIQDDWKVTSRLTLNLGTRYEIVLPWLERRDRMGIFDIDSDPAHPRLILAGSPEAGSGRRRRSLVAADSNNIMPRVGLAYRFHRHTVLRAAYGLFYGYMEPTGDAQFLIGNPPFAWSVNQTSSPREPVFELASGPPRGSLTLERATGLTFSSYERRPAREYAQQWTMSLQRQLGAGWLLEAGYAGAKGSHLLVRNDGNFSPPGPGNLDAKRPFQSAAIPGTDIIASPLGPVVYHHFSGNVTYHSFLAKLEKRFSRGFSLLASYTLSKTIGDTCGFAASGDTPSCGYQDPRRFQLEKSVDNQDVPHRLVVSGIWDLPFGRAGNWSGSAGSLARAALTGWSLGSIVTYSSGRPFNLVVPGNPANTGSLAIVNRPDLVGKPHEGERTVGRDFNTEAFLPNGQFAIGTLSRNALRQRDAFGWDFSAFKNISIGEALRCQIRFEAFQFTNTPRFGAPGHEVGTPDFGRITSAGTPRNLQLGLKLIF